MALRLKRAVLVAMLATGVLVLYVAELSGDRIGEHIANRAEHIDDRQGTHDMPHVARRLPVLPLRPHVRGQRRCL